MTSKVSVKTKRDLNIVIENVPRNDSEHKEINMQRLKFRALHIAESVPLVRKHIIKLIEQA